MEEYQEEVQNQMQNEAMLETQSENQAEAMEEQKEEQQFMASPQDPYYGGDGSQDLTGYSEQKPIVSLYTLFQDVLDKPSSIKVSNIDPKTELGDLGISVRDCMRIGLIGDTFHHPKFAKFFLAQANIITDSAMSKKGWFTELFITSKKFAEKSSSQNLNLPQPQPVRKKFSLFGGGQQQSQ